MPSPGTEPTSIALYPTAADRSTLTNAHQQYYLSPPLTPYPQFPTYHESLEQTSPHLHPFRPSLPALEEMLPHETREARSPPEPQRHRQHPSAVKQSPEQGLKDIMEHNSSSTYRGEQHLTDPARILPLYSSQSHTVLPQQTSIVSPLIRRNKAHVASACVNCKKAHLACDGTTSLTPLFCLSMDAFFLFQISFSTPPIMPTVGRFFDECFMHVKRRLRAGAPYFRIFIRKFLLPLFLVFLPIIRFSRCGSLIGEVRRLGGERSGIGNGVIFSIALRPYF